MSLMDSPLTLLEQPQPQRFRISAEAYHLMGSSGVLAPEARIELVTGELIDMAPTGTKHFWAVQRLSRVLGPVLQGKALLSVQSALNLDGFNEPVPDIAVLRLDCELKDDALPTGRDALLVVEVADSSLAYDFHTKAPLYARHGVGEYWIVDLGARVLHRFTQARDGQWTVVQSMSEAGVLELPGLAGLSVDLSGTF